MFDDLKKTVGDVLNSIGVKDEHDFSLSIKGTTIPVISGRVFRSMDTCADGCSATIILNDELKELIVPFGYEEAQVYLGGELVITGLIYRVDVNKTAEEKTVTLSIYSSACDIIDSTHYPPYEFNFVTLEEIADEMIGGLGFFYNFESDEGREIFDKVTIDPQQSIFNFLNELANQRGVLITSNEKGEVLFIRANVNSKPVETIINTTSISSSYDGRELFAIYRTSATTPYREKVTKKLKRKIRKDYVTQHTVKIAEAIDPKVPASRQTTFTADNVHFDEIETAANWERSKHWSNALNITVPRIGWRPRGSVDLYKENTLVTLKDDDLWLGKGFDFLIKSVEYVLESSGATSTLTLVPPQSFTGEEIPDIFGNEAYLLKSLGVEKWL